MPERFLRGFPSCLRLDARVAEEAVGVLGGVGVDVRLFERAEFPSREVEGVGDFSALWALLLAMMTVFGFDMGFPYGKSTWLT